MLSALWHWAVAFGLTQALEMPIYWRVSRSLRVAFFAGALTHPLVWFVFPMLEALVPWSAAMVAAEVFAVLVEAVWLRWNGVPRPLLWSVVANSFSATGDLLLRELTVPGQGGPHAKRVAGHGHRVPVRPSRPLRGRRGAVNPPGLPPDSALTDTIHRPRLICQGCPWLPAMTVRVTKAIGRLGTKRAERDTTLTGTTIAFACH